MDYDHSRRIADALERIAKALEASTSPVPAYPTYDLSKMNDYQSYQPFLSAVAWNGPVDAQGRPAPIGTVTVGTAGPQVSRC